MFERRVEAGVLYCVTPSKDCTVTTASGVPMLNVAAGTQDYFVATGGKVLVSDDKAVLTASRNPAWLASRNPAWLAEVRAGLDELGLAYELAWMPAGDKLVVHTDRADETQLEAVTALLERVLPQFIEVVRYNHNMEISWRDINKYAECRNKADLQAVNPNYLKDLTSDGEWVYPLTKLTGGWSQVFTGSPAKKAYYYIPAMTGLNELNTWSGVLEYVEIYAPKLQQLHQGFYNNKGNSKLNTVYGYLPLVNNGYAAFRGNDKLSIFEIDLPSLSSGSDMFGWCVLNKESALRILNSIPAYTSGSHPLTIGIHIDHQTDEEVLAAIANAEAKGWTLTVQWNGTPTAQAAVTYGLRKPPIYARVSEHDGKRFLDWGHYVTDTTGYEEFRSVEAAREYFGLPEEHLTNN